MNTHDFQIRHASNRAPFWAGVGLLAVVAGFFLWQEHRVHVLGALPWIFFGLFILACPLMHLFMHGGHRHGGGSGDHHTGRSNDGGES